MLFLLIATTYAQAVPAFPGLLKVRQPDGTSLTVRLIGDEFLNFYTTADGFSVVKNSTGAPLRRWLTTQASAAVPRWPSSDNCPGVSLPP